MLYEVNRTMIFKYYPHILAVFLTVFFIILGIDPFNRTLWMVEGTAVILVFSLLVITFHKFRFSNASYTMMSAWIILHTIGGHYSFSHVPFDFITNLFDFQRDNFDRLAHFSVGLYAFSITELLLRKKWANTVISSSFGFTFIMSVAAIYEIIEWAYAAIFGGDTGIAFLGSQGDVWDAQKDMLLDGLGAIFALILFWVIKPFKMKAP